MCYPNPKNKSKASVIGSARHCCSQGGIIFHASNPPNPASYPSSIDTHARSAIPKTPKRWSTRCIIPNLIPMVYPNTETPGYRCCATVLVVCVPQTETQKTPSAMPKDVRENAKDVEMLMPYARVIMRCRRNVAVMPLRCLRNVVMKVQCCSNAVVVLFIRQ